LKTTVTWLFAQRAKHCCTTGAFTTVKVAALLSALPLARKDWVSIAKNATWQTTRMNLNTFARHGVFEADGLVEACSLVRPVGKSITP